MPTTTRAFSFLPTKRAVSDHPNRESCHNQYRQRKRLPVRVRVKVKPSEPRSIRVQQARPSGSLNVPDTPSKAHLHLKLAPLQGVSYAQPLPEPNRILHQPTNRMKSEEWYEASFWLPHQVHLPVEAELVGGEKEKRVTVSGDWRQVVRWRRVDKGSSGALRKRK